MNVSELKFRAHSLRKYLVEHVVQGDYGRGWEDVNTELSKMAGGVSLVEYHLSEPQNEHRLIERRVPNPDHERFYVGQGVAVHPAHGEWMRGFKFGTVTAVGHRYVTVAWSVNPSVSARFITANVAPADGS